MNARNAMALCMTLLIMALRSTSVQADTLLFASEELSFPPEDAFCLSSDLQKTEVEKLWWLPAVQNKGAAAGGRWYFASVVSGETPANIFCRVHAQSGDSGVIVLKPWKAFEGAPERSDLEFLRSTIAQLRQDSADLRMENQKQEQQLTRVRSKAAVIVDLDHLLRTEEEQDSVARAVDGLEKDKANLAALTDLVRVQVAPESFSRREQMLVAQVRELSALQVGTSHRRQAK